MQRSPQDESKLSMVDPDDRQRLGALVERLDRLASSAEASKVTIYQRRLVTSDIASPTPIGLFAFSLATAFYMASKARITEESAQFLAFPLGIFLGGLQMFICGFLELYRKNSLAATAFCTFGAFWLSIGIYGILFTAGIFFAPAPEGEQSLYVLMGLASFVFMVVSLAANLAIPFLFFNVTIMFFLLAGGATNATCSKVAGWWGLWASAVAFYCGSAALFRDMWGKDVLPQRFTKPYLDLERIMFPRVDADHKKADLEAGALGM